MSTLLAILSVLPKLLSLVQFFMNRVHDAEQRGLGRKEAIAEAAEIVHRDLAWADAADNEAVQDHRAHPNDDGGFDPDGQLAMGGAFRVPGGVGGGDKVLTQMARKD